MGIYDTFHHGICTKDLADQKDKGVCFQFLWDNRFNYNIADLFEFGPIEYPLFGGDKGVALVEGNQDTENWGDMFQRPIIL